jgi:hypothetical protein
MNESTGPDAVTTSVTVPPEETTELNGALTSVGADSITSVGAELTVPVFETRLIPNRGYEAVAKNDVSPVTTVTFELDPVDTGDPAGVH